MRSLFIFLLFFSVISFGQTPANVDSLKVAIKKDPDDTNKAKQLNYLAWEVRNSGKFEEAAGYANEALALSRKLNYRWGIMNAYNGLGLIEGYKGNYPLALSNFLASLKMTEEMREPFHKANVLSNLGNLYYYQDNFSKALEYQQLALEIRSRMLKKERNTKTLRSIANSFTNIGIIYDDLRMIDTARSYHRRALKLSREGGSKIAEANALNNIGSCYIAELSFDSALGYFNEALKIYKQTRFLSGEETCLGNLADIYVKTKKFDLAEKAALESIKIAREIGELDGIKEASESLYLVYEQTGRYREALNSYKTFIAARDSLQNEENTKKTVRLEMQYEFDKKEAATKLEQEKKEVVAQAEVRRQKIILLAISGFGLLVLVFAIFAYRSFLQKKKANEEITRQKELIEVKQKEILDSIYYARRIQTALLPHETYLKRKLQELKKT